MRKQAPRTIRFVLTARARRRVLGDRHVEQRPLRRVAISAHPSFGEARLAIAQALHLGADELDAALDRLGDRVVVARLPVLDDRLSVGGTVLARLRHEGLSGPHIFADSRRAARATWGF